MSKLFALLNRLVHLNFQVVAGVTLYSKLTQALKRAVLILVVTPDRLMDLIQEKRIKLDDFSIYFKHQPFK